MHAALPFGQIVKDTTKAPVFLVEPQYRRDGPCDFVFFRNSERFAVDFDAAFNQARTRDQLPNEPVEISCRAWVFLIEPEGIQPVETPVLSG